MSGRRGGVLPVQGEDLTQALRALREDCGCEGRVVLKLARANDRDIVVTVEAYTDAGAPIGVARELAVWEEGNGRPLLTIIMMTLHKVYHEAGKKASAEYAVKGVPSDKR